MTLRAAPFFVAAAAALAALPGCLPSDDRPPPGKVTFTVSPSPAVRDGVTTEDGWNLTFSRFMVGIGRTGLSDGCAEYEEARYDRVLDVTKGERQKLSIIYGLGQCDVRFRIASPSPDAILGTGVTMSDAIVMGAVETDPYARAATSIWVEGRASRGPDTERFRWLFRKSFRFGQCRLPGDAGATPPIDLRGNEAEVQDLVIAGEALFRDGVGQAAKLRFEPFAKADRLGNADGTVDLDELELVPLATASAVASDAGGGDASSPDAQNDVPGFADGSAPYTFSEGGSFRASDGAADTVATLRDYVYVLLLPTLPLLQGTEPCIDTGPQRFR